MDYQELYNFNIAFSWGLAKQVFNAVSIQVVSYSAI